MEALALLLKAIIVMVALPAVVLGVIVGARWYKEPHRSIKIVFLGFSVTLGEDK